MIKKENAGEIFLMWISKVHVMFTHNNDKFMVATKSPEYPHMHFYSASATHVLSMKDGEQENYITIIK